ncbi:MAG TPA: hypothetical protein VGM12_33155 [Trebonia sp.]
MARPRAGGRGQLRGRRQRLRAALDMQVKVTAACAVADPLDPQVRVT